MSKVAIKIPKGSNWDGGIREMSRVPNVGEYVCLGKEEPWFRVAHVIHCAFDTADVAAEVYTEAKEIDQTKLVADLQRAATPNSYAGLPNASKM